MRRVRVEKHHSTQMVRVSAVPSRTPPRVTQGRHDAAGRQDYPISLKRQICRLCEAQPGFTIAQLVEHIHEQLGIRIPPSTLTRIRVGRERWFTALHLERRRL